MSFPYAAVIFDMDGLIFDTEPLYRTAWQRASAQLGFDLTDAIYLRLIGLGRTGSERVLSAEFGPAFSPEKFRSLCKAIEREVLATTPPAEKPGFRALLDFLKSQNVPMALATSTDRAVADIHLTRASLTSSFAVSIAGDEVQHAKPAPDLYLRAAEKLAAAPQRCLVLEDSAPGVFAARSAGMDVFVVPDQIAPSPEVVTAAAGVFGSLFDVKSRLESELLPEARTLRARNDSGI
ncbi:MAG TPA: HAD family phosphatase [Candidatus Acidoferrales bacterium]|nr:HAD family phosphatase [Candidatus Acidoferrales bacterium]